MVSVDRDENSKRTEDNVSTIFNSDVAKNDSSKIVFTESDLTNIQHLPLTQVVYFQSFNHKDELDLFSDLSSNPSIQSLHLNHFVGTTTQEYSPSKKESHIICCAIGSNESIVHIYILFDDRSPSPLKTPRFI